MSNVLIIAAHPDDETIGMGGTIARHVSFGDKVFVLILSDGVGARHSEIEMQKNAAIQACKIMGVVGLEFAGLPDQAMDALPLLEVIRPIEALIKKIKPSIVYTHHQGDINQDHRTAFSATMVATRPVQGSVVQELYCYEVASSTEWAPPLDGWTFRPNYFVNIDLFLKIKIEAANSYSKTFQNEIPPYPHPRSLMAIDLYARKRGVEVGFNAAEAFMVIRRLNN